MDYGFTEEEVLLVWQALNRMKEYYLSRQNSKETRRRIREVEAVIQKLESQDPNLRIWQASKERFPSSSP